MGQSCYWVFLKDKEGVTFDPYAYFDAKAVARYRLNGAALDDMSNYPLNEGYVSQVLALADEVVGQSRWFNAVAVMASPDQIGRIGRLPFVDGVRMIYGGTRLASHSGKSSCVVPGRPEGVPQPVLMADQLVRMQGELFCKGGLDGKGMRIAVFDGGFPRVNTHEAFRHLREGGRILDTWNFPNRTADVYGWNSHGLSTLSCIAGIVDGQHLGLATGAEFLLYRTEVEAEPFKEEVWWMEAVERSDRQGANIISSSLGYGKERYHTRDMDGTSFVAKAANMAARKGILVVNSAGNEGDTRQWKTIITPADADSVLCVGGIESDLARYKHIDFSSYGPSADGRLKPNVCAYGHALAAANSGDDKTQWVYGTSFSCPLTAGFAACAWQSCPDKTAMEMMDLIQRSADLYPYYDYALGYGVPQASFFVGGPKDKAPTFTFEEDKENVYVVLGKKKSGETIFFNKQRPDGSLEKYSCAFADGVESMVFAKGSLDSCALNVSYLGYTDSYRLSMEDRQAVGWNPRPFEPGYRSADIGEGSALSYVYSRTGEDLLPSKWGSNAMWEWDCYVQLGLMVPTRPEEHASSIWSPSTHLGFRLLRALSKSYKIGMGLGYAVADFNYPVGGVNGLDLLYGHSLGGVDKKQLKQQELALELFQRVRLVPMGGMVSKGLHWDLGLYGSYGWNSYTVRYGTFGHAAGATFEYRGVRCADIYRLNWGVVTRFTYNAFGIYARYRMTSLPGSGAAPGNGAVVLNLPRLEVGLQFCL